ncbi:hypothetical protein ACP4OV_029593 [Aristida adscensionis]
MMASASHGKAEERYKKAVAMAATATAYTVLARTVAQELLPPELRAAARRAVSAVLPWRRRRRTKTILIARHTEKYGVESALYWDVRAYLSSRIDPAAMDQLGLADGGQQLLTMAPCQKHQQLLSILPGESTADVFEGVKFTWTLTDAAAPRRRRRDDDDDSDGDDDRRRGRCDPDTLALSFAAEHVDVAMSRYDLQDVGVVLDVRGLSHNHPATFDTVAMDPALKQDIIDDLDRFLGRREYYKRIGKAWKRGYLLYGPPGTGKSSLVAAMANYLRFNLYDLDVSEVHTNATLQRLLTTMNNKSILVIEDIDCCFSTKSREGGAKMERTTKNGDGDGDSDHCSSDDESPPPRNGSDKKEGVTVSGLLNFIDGLWSTAGEERIIVFTTNYKERLDPALLRPGRMDMHIYMGYCCWRRSRRWLGTTSSSTTTPCSRRYSNSSQRWR